MIHVFHGFLGSPNDFSFLKAHDIIFHDIYDLENIPVINPEDVVIGYSMGGRIALELIKKINFNIKKLVLISAHPGLQTEKERLKRKEFEVTVLQELKNKTRDEFIKSWNHLPIFLFDSPIEMNDETRFRKSAEVFNHYRLSNQDNHLLEIIKNKHKVFWIIGTLDDKYMDLSNDLLVPNGIKVKYVDGGHRLFQKSDDLIKILKEESIL